MSDVSAIEYDETGKMDLSDIYNQDDPTRYFSKLSRLDYRVPQEAKQAFRRIIAARRAATHTRDAKIVDIGCSYGVNAALLKFDLSLADLSRHYLSQADRPRQDLIAADAELYATPADPDLEIVGVDPAHRALHYAIDAGILDGGISTDLESRDPTGRDAALMAKTDLVISTGCYGYVTKRTLEAILDQCEESRPWMAHTVLRMFDFADASEALAERGYVTEKVEGLVPQRRFASPEERAHVLDNLAAAGVDPTGREAEGWYYAELYVSRPLPDAGTIPLDSIVGAPASVV